VPSGDDLLRLERLAIDLGFVVLALVSPITSIVPLEVS
jgi:hypothetical protein